MKNNTFGQKLKLLRKNRGLTERQLGECLNFSNQSVSFWENGEREPKLDTLIAIAKFFDVSVDYLLGISEF